MQPDEQAQTAIQRLARVEQMVRQMAESNKTYLTCLHAALTALEAYRHGLSDEGQEAGRVIGEITLMLTIENLASMDIDKLVREIADRRQKE